MSNFTIHSFSEKTGKAKFSVNGSKEKTTIEFDDAECEDPTKIMAIFRAYATDGGVRPLKNRIYKELPIGVKVDCETMDEEDVDEE